jgi:hypothetical protein
MLALDNYLNPNIVPDSHGDFARYGAFFGTSDDGSVYNYVVKNGPDSYYIRLDSQGKIVSANLTSDVLGGSAAIQYGGRTDGPPNWYQDAYSRITPDFKPDPVYVLGDAAKIAQEAQMKKKPGTSVAVNLVSGSGGALGSATTATAEHWQGDNGSSLSDELNGPGGITGVVPSIVPDTAGSGTGNSDTKKAPVDVLRTSSPAPVKKPYAPFLVAGAAIAAVLYFAK